MDKVFMPHRGMRYLLSCLLSLALLAPATARAIDFKISGDWQILLEESNVTPRGVDGADSFGALQRFRIQLDAVASENLSGSVQFELGRTEWGQSATGGALGADGTVAEVRHAYLDWQLPQTDIKVRMGLQPLMLPGIVSGFSATWCHDMAGISLGAPLYDSQDLDAELALFWARPYNDNSEATFGPDKATRHLDNMDVFALSLPVRGERFKINPWAMYAMIGQYRACHRGAAWWSDARPGRRRHLFRVSVRLAFRPRPGLGRRHLAGHDRRILADRRPETLHGRDVWRCGSW